MHVQLGFIIACIILYLTYIDSASIEVILAVVFLLVVGVLVYL